MSSTLDRHLHPVLACAETIGAALKDTADVPVTFMSLADKRAALVELTRLEAQLSALKLRVVAVSDDVALAEGARDVAALLTHRTRGDYGANRRDLALAEALDRRWSGVAAGLGGGDLDVARRGHHARPRPAARHDVPADVLRERGGPPGRAGRGVRSTRPAGPGRRILDIVAPEIGEQHEAEQLAAEERRADAQDQPGLHRPR